MHLLIDGICQNVKQVIYTLASSSLPNRNILAQIVLLFDRMCSKVNQVIYTLSARSMSNMSIVAQSFFPGLLGHLPPNCSNKSTAGFA